MVVKPNQITELSPKEKKQIKSLETQIDKALTKYGVEDMSPDVFYRPPGEITRRVIEHIQKMYRAVGWTVSYELNQRKGDFLRFRYKR